MNFDEITQHVPRLYAAFRDFTSIVNVRSTTLEVMFVERYQPPAGFDSSPHIADGGEWIGPVDVSFDFFGGEADADGPYEAGKAKARELKGLIESVMENAYAYGYASAVADVQNFDRKPKFRLVPFGAEGWLSESEKRRDSPAAQTGTLLTHVAGDVDAVLAQMNIDDDTKFTMRELKEAFGLDCSNSTIRPCLPPPLAGSPGKNANGWTWGTVQDAVRYLMIRQRLLTAGFDSRTISRLKSDGQLDTPRLATVHRLPEKAFND